MNEERYVYVVVEVLEDGITEIRRITEHGIIALEMAKSIVGSRGMSGYVLVEKWALEQSDIGSVVAEVTSFGPPILTPDWPET